jgi:hypothetical protein
MGQSSVELCKQALERNAPKKRAPRDVPQALKGLREIWRPARLMAMLSRYSICVWLCSSIRTLIRYILCVRLVWWFRGIQFQGNCLSDRSEVALFQRNFLKMGFKNIYWGLCCLEATLLPWPRLTVRWSCFPKRLLGWAWTMTDLRYFIHLLLASRVP